MSIGSLLGLVWLNALFLVGGLALLWWIRGFATWSEVARLAGLAYIGGVAVVGTTWTLLVIVGVPFPGWTVLAVPAAAIALGLVGAVRAGRARPRRSALALGRGAFVSAVGIAATGLLLEAMFRGARLSGLYWWDAWAFWVPKAKILYLWGGLDKELFSTLPGSGYPPLVPVLDAAAFHAMGSADVVTLHIQYWLFGVGFVWALAGLLAEHVPSWILWPFVLLMIVAPRIGPRFFITEADLLLDVLFALAALLLVLWVRDRAPWRLIATAVLMSAMVSTKREGLLLVAVLVVSAALVSLREWRYALPRIGVVVFVVAAVAAPWRIWYVANGIKGEAPTDPTPDLDRLWPSVRLALDVLFSSDYWSVIVPVAIGAIVLAALARQFVFAGFAGAAVLLVIAGGAWITWAIPELPITEDLGGNPIVRYMGAAALLCVATSPLLIASAWSAATHTNDGRAP
jgi:hypothetical protein